MAFQTLCSFTSLTTGPISANKQFKNDKISTEQAAIYATKHVDISSAVRMLPRSKIFDVVVSLTKCKPLVHRKSLAYLHFPRPQQNIL